MTVIKEFAQDDGVLIGIFGIQTVLQELFCYAEPINVFITLLKKML